jgi:cobyrinic acid a,c-diamide synthase
MADRYQALDHVELTATGSTPVSNPGGSYYGHEFHYSSATVASDAQFVFDVERGDGIEDDQDGLVEYRTVGTYCHTHPERGVFEPLLGCLDR